MREGGRKSRRKKGRERDGKTGRERGGRPRKGLSSPIRQSDTIFFCPLLGTHSPLGKCDRLRSRMKSWSYCVNLLTIVAGFCQGQIRILFSVWTLIGKFLFSLKRAKFTVPPKASLCTTQRSQSREGRRCAHPVL